MPLYFFIMVGGFFYESTLGYYWVARGRFSSRDAVKSVLKLPTFYALFAGLACNAAGLTLPAMWEGIARDFMGAYVILGALILGFAIGQNKKFVLNPRFLGALYGIKFLVWPAVMFGLLAVLRAALPNLPQAASHCALLMAIMPLAANTAALAALLKVHPEETATAVALSTVLSLVTVPVYALLFGLA
jgi:predicted permease